ncbi:MAG: DNA mismatch repair endonuclease MutL [Lachnospiraceae bacterium]|nr:DNA mismatch repair endonuclease MutL [Lachnospiraceae bacterium]
MGKIHLLDQSTINQIAAGEVIDRPVSVVKELMENAVDAGATAVTVEIKQGGTTLIRITDNGSGISPEDIPEAFRRHSTSKISQAADLLTVSSLGFRGEALSSVAAVSRVELITRTHSSLVGSRYVIEGGKELTMEEAGAPEGTTIIVRDLFYNTPARRKFLKTPATEGGYIFDMIGKIALSRPDISFRFIQNGQNRLHTSGNHNLKDVIYHVYGREITREVVPISYESSFFRIDGYIGKPLISRSTRACEIYFINGRYIRSNLVNKAIEEGYRNFLMQHKFPFTVFNITIDPEFTDVNVHPSKMELRFRNQEFLYEEIVTAVRRTLTQGELSPDFTVESGKKKEMHVPEKAAEQREMHAPEKTAEQREMRAPENSPVQREVRAPGNASVQKEAGPVPAVDREKDCAGGSPSAGQKGTEPVPVLQKPLESVLAGQKPPGSVSEDQKSSDSVPAKKNPKKERGPEPFETRRMEKQIKEEKALYEAEAVDVRQQNLFEDKLLTVDTVSEIKLAGQIFDTYWIVQYQDTFLIIDQHAAHEKVLYESIIKRLKNQEYTTQQMNPPAIISLTPRQQGQFAELSGLLAEMGFEVEPFGGNEYAVYGMPDNLVGADPMDLLDEILETAGDKGRITPEAVYEKAASLACKAAIKGNQHLSETEAVHLIADLVNLENPYTCPHGRPTMIKMTKYELEKKFKRVL